MPDKPDLTSLLADLADGAEIDWLRAAETPEAQRDPGLLSDLQLLAGVARISQNPESPRSRDVDRKDTDETAEPMTWGHLAVIRRLGRGGFGDVFLAQDTHLHRLVALKLLREDMSFVPGLEDRLLKEARVLASVDHPNVVTVHGADVQNERAGFWMAYIDGPTLEEALATRGPFDPRDVAAIGQDVCRALSAVHAAGLIHRDVKARNIMRDKHGRHVLMDFGAWVSLRDSQAGHPRVGTPLYLSPEVLAGGEASVASDLYATSVLLFHLLTRKFPRSGDSAEELRRAHEREERLMLDEVRPGLPAPLVAVIERGLAPKPEQRFVSAEEMRSALEAAVAVPPPGPLGRLIEFVRTVPPLWRAVLTTAGVVTLALLFWNSKAPPASVALPTIAVGLFESVSPPVEPSVAFGLTQDVIAQLRRRGLTVRGGESVSVASTLSLPEVRSQFQVDTVLKGLISKPVADQLAIDIRLIRVPDGKTIWSHRFAPRTADLPGAAVRIAAEISAALGGNTVAPNATQPSYQAYDAYMRGRYLAEGRTQESLSRAIESYRQAIAADQAYAPPWVGIADAYIALGIPTFGPLRPMDSRRLAKEAVLRALEIDPDSAEAHATLGFIAYFHDWSWNTAEQEFVRSIALNPQYARAHHWYADYLNGMGRTKDALREIGIARSIEPMSSLIHRDVAWHYFFQRRYAEADAQLRDVLKTDPQFGPALSLLARVLAAEGRYAEALDVLQRAGLRPGTNLTTRAYIEALAGDRTAAMRDLNDALALPPTEYLAPYYVALVYAAFDDADKTIRWLDRARDEQDSTLVNIYTDPRFDTIRSDVRFQELVSALGFPSRR